MGMRIGHSSNTGMASGVGIAHWQQRQQGVKDMVSALQAGDLAGAQKAFGSLPGAANIASSGSNSPLAQTGKALQAGDLDAARQAAQAFQTARSGHHHQAAAPMAPAAGAGPGGTGNLLNLTA